MLVYFYLFLHIYLHNFLPQWTHYGTHCSLKLSEFTFPIPDPTSAQVINYKQPSDVLSSYPKKDVYLITLKIGLVPQHNLPEYSIPLFHIAIKNLSGILCYEIIEKYTHRLHNTWHPIIFYENGDSVVFLLCLLH